MIRRRQNVQDYGSAWIRPPGVPKSLHQMREERREMEEHREAMRREALAQELAVAEAEGLEALMGDGEEGEGEDMMDEGRDLDDDVPEAEADETGLGDDDDEEEEEDNEETTRNTEGEVPRGVLASRLPEEAYREALVSGEGMRGAMFGDDAASILDLDLDARSQMLQEEDLVRETHANDHEAGDLDMDAQVDLDDEIPEAEEDEEGGYEHTDTEAELSSSEDDARGVFSRQHPASSMVRSDGTQNSMDLGNRRSRGSSSLMGSSPAARGGGRGRRS